MPTLKITHATPEEIDDMAKMFSILLSKFNNYVEFADTAAIDNIKSYNHGSSSHDLHANGKHFAHAEKSRKRRVPTPFKPSMTEWLSDPVEPKEGAIASSSSGWATMEFEGEAEVREMTEAEEAQVILKSCKDRVATPYNPRKNSWL